MDAIWDRDPVSDERWEGGKMKRKKKPSCVAVGGAALTQAAQAQTEFSATE